MGMMRMIMRMMMITKDIPHISRGRGLDDDVDDDDVEDDYDDVNHGQYWHQSSREAITDLILVVINKFGSLYSYSLNNTDTRGRGGEVA